LRLLTPRREQWLKAAYRRHAVKTIVTARHVMGLRAAAFLTAGIAHVPFWKFLVIDAAAALVGVPVVFGLAYFFTDQIQSIVRGVHRVERWLGLGVLIVLGAAFGISAWRWNRRLEEESLDLGPSPRS
jgi:membrane protein DedA with SNARE-associated domain